MSLYLVTGGAGFIGSHLVDALLAAGHGVRVLDDLSTGKRQNLDERAELRVGDVAALSVVADAMEGVAGCFHLAAVASVQRCNEDWVGTHRTNATGTVVVLDAARRHGRLPVVYASSAAVYGDLGGAIATETAHCAPLTAYGADKLASELHAAVGWQVHAVPSVGLRLFNVYGPRQDPASPYSGVISIFADRVASGQGIVLHGDGGQTRDFVHVFDVVAHLSAAMGALGRTPGATVLNVCTGVETSVAALAALVGQVAGRKAVITQGPARAGDIRRSVGDRAAALLALGIGAGVGLADGLRTLVGEKARE
ncbi:MAG: NAD-dependent epimerase/dehydratase family protein [Rhodospirillales bacterium]